MTAYKIAQHMVSVIKNDFQVESATTSSMINELGLDSLDLMELAYMVENNLKIQLPSVTATDTPITIGRRVMKAMKDDIANLACNAAIAMDLLRLGEHDKIDHAAVINFTVKLREVIGTDDKQQWSPATIMLINKVHASLHQKATRFTSRDEVVAYANTMLNEINRSWNKKQYVAHHAQFALTVSKLST